MKDAVITVPAYFDDKQRQATKNAGEIAGLNVLRIINEPTAAAYTYGMQQPEGTMKTVLVYDFGGGTLDITILTIDKTKDETDFKVLATHGDTKLGGEDFDNMLVHHCIDKFEDESGEDVSKIPKAVARIKAECEIAKMQLSTAEEATIELDEITVGNDLSIKVTRKEFEEIADGLFKKSIPLCKKALEDAKVEAEGIDEIVLVGGSCRIPRVQSDL